ncbi:Aste57867_15057 [Aphanomyces stellatus]|uniref:Aste57867_15057 protein n=1 Tax=Aphanomyces stellatus TaxID=120398 RepID=A0A485L2A1_9STRA|nr:hypothetical protein As57867_015001 [Aphanomyces stellatus]VFT91871.1 Aste57867_15057 [Aphanomyces stellatus]
MLWRVWLVATVIATSEAFIKKIVSFGDSLTDTGNGAYVLTKGLVPSNAYWQGRFSNGPTYIEVTAAALQATLANFAVGGATADNSLIPGVLGNTSDPNAVTIRGIPSVKDQVAAYLKTRETVRRDNIIYTIWIGNNDDDYNTAFKYNRAAVDVVRAVHDSWCTLAQAGATKIVTVAPIPLDSPFLASFNIHLHKFAVLFRVSHPWVTLGIFESAALVADISIYPPQFGFYHGLTDPCCTNKCYTGLPPQGTANVCATPDAYIVFDAFYHPTAATHRLIAARLVNFIQKWFD